MRFALQRRAHFSYLIRPHGPAPAALASLLSHPPDPHCFATFHKILPLFSSLSGSSYLKPRPSSGGARKPMCPSPHAMPKPRFTCPTHAHAWQARAGPCAKAVHAQATPTQARAILCTPLFSMSKPHKETVWGNNRALNCKSCKTFEAHPFAPNSLLNLGLESHGTTMWSNTRTSQGRKFQARHCPYLQNRNLIQHTFLNKSVLGAGAGNDSWVWDRSL